MNTHPNLVGGKARISARSFASHNPATGEVLGHVPHCDADEVAQALAAARAAQPGWAATPDAERKAALMNVAQAIADKAETLARWVAREQGKPLGGVGPGQIPGARFEVAGCQAWTQVPASLDLAPEVVYEDAGRRDELRRAPYGVIAAIAPWNWPLLIAIWQLMPAIRAGNTVVLKPSELTSICSLELARVIGEVLPAGVVNTVTGPGEVGAALVDCPGVDKILFTGSAATGAKVAAAAARRLVPTTLELGGNDAAIVLPGTDVRAIAMGLFWGAFINMGQTCACAKRVYVHRSQHDALVEALADIARSMPMGDPLDESNAFGPIQNRMQYDKVVDLVESARAQGGRVVCGGTKAEGAGYFHPITLVTGLRDGARLVDEEQFGPVLPIVAYDDLEQAIASANRLAFGLGASVWAPSVDAALPVASRLQAGTVWINQHGTIHPLVPFGGTKASGWGLEFGIEGLKSVTQARVISIAKGGG
jgi:acyl-CoA reductase-like NAD-dependent aldehyde dehydrogenase